MARCRHAGCSTQTTNNPYCPAHKGTLNIVLPSTPMRVKVMEQLEWDRMEAEMQTRARTTSAAPPKALATVRPSPPPSRRPAPPPGQEAVNLQKNTERMRVSYAGLLASRKIDSELIGPMKAAFHEIMDAPSFKGYMDEEIGWTLSAKLGFMARALAPAMMVRPIAEEVRDTLRRKALLAGVGGKMFADRYFFELSLYCDAVIMKADIEFIFGQASQVLGPILAPVYAAVAAAVPVVGRGASAAVNVAAKKGLQRALVNEPTYETIPAGAKPKEPMRFTLAWLDFVTNEREPADAVAAILAEFGGLRGCRSLAEWLKSANM